jgi:hypothetical protein
MYTRKDFAEAFLKELGAPVTKRNLWALLSWMQAEGNAGKFNPLNTTQEMPGATNFNSVGVKNYTSFEQGVEATVDTLNWGADRDKFGYKPIRRRLKKNAWARNTLMAVEDSMWGTGGLALQCLRFVKRSFESYSNKTIVQ